MYYSQALRFIVRPAARACRARTAMFEARGGVRPTLKTGDVVVSTPYVSDSVPVPDELGAISEIYCKVGDHITMDSTVVTVETHKANLDVRSPVAGVVAQVLVSVDDEVRATAAAPARPLLLLLCLLCPPRQRSGHTTTTTNNYYNYCYYYFCCYFYY